MYSIIPNKTGISFLILSIMITGWIFQPPMINAAFSAESKLESEVQKIINAGDHLKPGYFSGGMLDMILGRPGRRSDFFNDYFHNPADTIYTLSIAYPHLSSSLKGQVETYLQTEYRDYPVNSLSHIGWGNGASRDLRPWPQDLDLQQQGTSTSGWGSFWSFPPLNFYAAYKYAENVVPSQASSIFIDMNAQISNLQNPPADSVFTSSSFINCPPEPVPHALNAWIAGYYGYLGLERMVTGSETQSLRTTLNRLVGLRLSMLGSSKSEAITNAKNLRAMEGGGFIHLVPELGEQMKLSKNDRVQDFVDTYNIIMPYWFETGAQEQIRDPNNCLFDTEGSNTNLQVVHSLFMARAYALEYPLGDKREQLELYIDAPYFERGDLYYIQNLVAVIQAGPGGATHTPTPTDGAQTPSPTTVIAEDAGDADKDSDVDLDDFAIWIDQYLNPNISFFADPDFNNDEQVDGRDFVIWLVNYSP